MVALKLFVIVVACFTTGCGSGTPPSSTDDSGPDSDTDSDSDTDTDTDTDSDTDTGPYTTDAGPWEWQDNPDGGEDCGPGCRQVTFSDDVRANEWDVWEDRLAYSADDSIISIFVVDVAGWKFLKLPFLYPALTWETTEWKFWPSIWEETIFYRVYVRGSDPQRTELVLCDLGDESQSVAASQENPPWEEGSLAEVQNTDIGAGDLVSIAGCDDPDDYNVCYYHEPFVGNGTSLLDGGGGGFNGFTTIWERKIVFLDATAWPTHDVRGFDLSTEQFFDVTDDDYYQNTPRIGSDKVVWQDFRYSDYAPWEKHSNTVIFAKDLDTGVTTQLTDGSAIAASPDVHGDVAVWLDWRHCADPQGDVYMDFECAEVYGRNLSTGTEARITNIPDRAKSTPRIWGDRVFVEMKTEAGSAIFMIELPVELE